MPAPQGPRPRAVPKARKQARDKGLPAAAQQEKALAAAPAYLQGRVERGEPLPDVVAVVKGGGEDAEEAVGVLKYAVGLDGDGLPEELFAELLELWCRDGTSRGKGCRSGPGRVGSFDLIEGGLY